jgi:hypothetical protein
MSPTRPVRLNEVLALDEYSLGATTGIVDAALIGSEHLATARELT